VVICLERGADLHTAQLMLLPLTVTHCLLLQENSDWFYLSGTGSPGYSPGKGAVKRVCVWYSQVVTLNAIIRSCLVYFGR